MPGCRDQGRPRFHGNAGGEITRCEPPRLLSVTWEFGGGVSWLTVTLADDPAGGTQLELEHLAPLESDHSDRFGPGAVGVGWDLALVGLARHLASGAAVDRAAAMARPGYSISGRDFAGDEGIAYLRLSIAT